MLKVNKWVQFFPNKQGTGPPTWLTGTVTKILDCSHSYTIHGPSGTVYRRYRAHLKPICYDGTSFQDHAAKKEETKPEIDSFREPKPTKVKTVSFKMDTSYVDDRSMFFDEVDTYHIPASSPLPSPQWLYSPSSPSYSPPAPPSSRESSVEPHSEDSTSTGRKRHQSEPAFIRPQDIDRGLTCGLSAFLREMSTPTTLQVGEISQSKSQTGFQQYALNSFQDPASKIKCNLVQRDSFQDPFMCKLTPFKTITVAYMAIHQKLTPFKTPVQIDSFQDPNKFIYNTKLCKFTHFKTIIYSYTALNCSN